jgi:hypothetical protein
MDQDLQTVGNLTLKEIVDSVAETSNANDESDYEVLIEEQAEISHVTRKDAQKFWDGFRRYMEVDCANPNATLHMDKLDDMFTFTCLQQEVQSKMTDFFQKNDLTN